MPVSHSVMGKPNVLLQMCFLVWLLLSPATADCVYEECYCSSVVILCSNKHLLALPRLNTSFTSPGWDLDMGSNNISSIPSGSLPWNLTNLDLDGSPITTIDDNAFQGSVNTLASIYLSTVRFTKFPNAFGLLRALTELSITGANITDWNNEAWKTFGQTLETLNLDNVGITSWPSWTQYFGNLTFLTMSRGSISSIPDHALDHVANSLTNLDLNNNRLTMVPRAISKLASLQVLSLYQNHITDLTWLPHNNNLNRLSVSYNYISNSSHLSQALRPLNGSLWSIDIDNNLLSIIPDFSFLIKVTDLDFSHNRLSNSDSGQLSTDIYLLDLSYNSLSLVPSLLSSLVLVTDITLSYNVIKGIQEADFHDQVMSIDLGYNLITEITDASFPDNFGLLYLQLNNNPLTTISPVALQRLPHLYELNLRHTQLTRLPLALRYLTGLVTLDVSDNGGLVCTCLESSLATWVVKPPPHTILGNCGQTSVYDFFSILSQDCPTN